MWEEQLNAAIEAGVAAIKGILEIYNTDFDVEIKDDNSPVTLADKNADKVIREHLHKAFPSYAFLTEETDDDLSRLNNDYVWIVDPVDGTITFDFVEDKDQKEFCEYLKMPLKSESMIFAKNCRFRNGHPEKGKEYYLNVVDLKDEVTFKEKNDHAVIGLEVDFSGIAYNPFYDNEEDIDEDPDGDDLFEGDELSEINPEALKKVKGFLDSLGN